MRSSDSVSGADNNRVTFTKHHEMPFATYRPLYAADRAASSAALESARIALYGPPAMLATAAAASVAPVAPVAPVATQPELHFVQPILPTARYPSSRLFAAYFATEESKHSFGYYHHAS